MSRTCPLHVRYMSVTCPLHVPYMSHAYVPRMSPRMSPMSRTCPVHVPYMSRHVPYMSGIFFGFRFLCFFCVFYFLLNKTHTHTRKNFFFSYMSRTCPVHVPYMSPCPYAFCTCPRTCPGTLSYAYVPRMSPMSRTHPKPPGHTHHPPLDTRKRSTDT